MLVAHLSHQGCCKMLIWLTLGCEFGASLILVCVNAIVALALIALSLSLAVAVSLLANCANATGKSSLLFDVRRDAHN
jgi:hypothetical protein